MSDFNVNKYLGTWYELAHYPSWFQRNDNYNTMAEYNILPGDSPLVQVHNSTISKGKRFDSMGVASYLGGSSFRVDFPRPEISKLQQSGEFKMLGFPVSGQIPQELTQNGPNYVVDMIWTNKFGDYVFAVVTDPSRQSLYVLSRYKNPSLVAYNQIMEYVVQNYDRDRLVQTPHFN